LAEDYSKYQGLLALGATLNPIQIKYIHSEADIRANFKGNQAGGTGVVAMDIAMRLLRIHPVKKRNVLNKPIRCVSKVKPKQEGDEENQQYVELLRLIPQYLIKKDVTARSSTMTIRDPLGGPDNKVEFMSSSQELEAFMSVQRSANYQDEEIDKSKWDDSCVRLLKEGGDATINLTPAKGLDWVYDSIWLKAGKIFRSKTICDRFGFPAVEDTGRNPGIEAFCWATDDNPALRMDDIERIFAGIDDPDDLAMRRYGIFRQASGVIYKVFNEKIHKQPYDKVFDASFFRTYWNFRVIDYHPTKPWAVSWVCVSPHHEWFVWHELEARHDNRVTLELRDQIKSDSLLDEDEMFNRCTLIDPLSTVKQGNTGFSTFDDLSMGENGLRRLTPADTKNTQGQMNVKMRMKNSLICGVPGNNLNKTQIREERYGDYLPTIWILDNCKKHIEHLKNWRLVDYKQESVKAVKVAKKPSEKYSDFCRNLEFLGALNPVMYEPKRDNHFEPSKLFQGRRAA
jgi:hypothetical protein